MSSKSSRTEEVAAQPRTAVATRRNGGESKRALVDIPLEQAVVLAQFPRGGILDVDLARRLGMTETEATKVRGVLLRRKLLQRVPAGRPRASSRVLLTQRGQQASAWLQQLQTSLPADLFDGQGADLSLSGLSTTPNPSAVGLAALETSSGPLSAVRRLRGRWHRRDAWEDFGERTEEGIFERGIEYVWLGTCSFGGAVLVGILLQTERAALVALGFGCFLAMICFGRVGIIAFHNARARAEHHPRRWGWHRSRPRPRRAAH
ncbi:MAG: hypothetical protein WBA31_01410 [Candidatus Dormiibacterota bacterium]